MSGTLALVGGREFTEGCTFDEALVADTDEVLVVPTALAYENPSSTIERATTWFSTLGVRVRVLEVFVRSDAMQDDAVQLASQARAVYVTGGSPMHLRSVLKGSPLLDALVSAWAGGANVATAGEACAVLCSHMVDSRGGAFTVGLDLITTMTVVPKRNNWSPDKLHRTVELAPKGLPVVGIDDATALLYTPSGTWEVDGAGAVAVYEDGVEVGLDALPATLDGSLPVS